MTLLLKLVHKFSLFLFYVLTYLVAMVICVKCNILTTFYSMIYATRLHTNFIVMVIIFTECDKYSSVTLALNID